jgi:hypothetical protein
MVTTKEGFFGTNELPKCPKSIIVIANHLGKPKNKSKFEIVDNYSFTPLAKKSAFDYFYAMIN